MINGDETYKGAQPLDAIKYKVLHNIKLNKQEEHLLETLDEQNTAKEEKNYTKDIYNIPLYGQTYTPYAYVSNDGKYIPTTGPSWEGSFDNIQFTFATSDFYEKITQEEKNEVEYLGLYQLVIQEESDEFDESQVLSCRWLTKADDKAGLEQQFAFYAQGWSEAQERQSGWDSTCLTLLFTPIGINKAIVVDMDEVTL